MPEVKIQNPSSMNMLGLIIKNIVDKNIANSRVYAKIADVESTINIQAGKMQIHLIMESGRLEIKHGLHPNPTARVSGSMGAIMNIGKRHFHKVPLDFLKLNFRVGGNVFALLPLLSIMKM